MDWKGLAKKIKKSEVAIYAIALMLVAAGYFNYISIENKQHIAEVSSDVEENTNTENVSIGDAVLVNNNELVENENWSEVNTATDTNTSTNINENISTNAEINTNNDTSTNNDTNTNVNTNTEISDEDNYYASSKLDREKMYAQSLSNYEQILNNQNVSEAQKSIATQEITKINNTKNAIMICENLIITKGFKNCVIFVNENSVNVVVEAEEKLDKDDVAKIQNIISREMGTAIENIHISERK